MLLHGGLGDDELRGDRPDRRRLGERVARQQRTAERHEHVALARRERRRLGDRRRLLPARRAVEQEAEPSERDLVAGVQRALADDPVAVDERAVAGAEVADAPRVAEPLEHRVHARDAVAVDDEVVRLERADRHALRVQRAKLPAASAPHLDVAAHRLSQARRRRGCRQPRRAPLDKAARELPSPSNTELQGLVRSVSATSSPSGCRP